MNNSAINYLITVGNTVIVITIFNVDDEFLIQSVAQ